MGGAVAACAPPFPLAVLPPDGVSALRYARGPVPPKRRAAALIGFAPFPLPPPPLAQMASSAGGKSLRARCGVPLRPPCALAAPSRAAAAAGGPSGRLPPSHFFGVVAVGSSGATPPPSPRSPVLLRATKVGGACSSGLWPPRRCGGAPLRSGPAPRFWPRGGAILFSLRRVWGLRRLRAALEVYRTARAAQCRCGVHSFAMNPYHLVSTCNRALLS